MTLKEAITTLINEFDIGSYVYDVRERATTEDRDYTGSSWAHPDVVKFGDCIMRLKEEVDELSEPQSSR